MSNIMYYIMIISYLTTDTAASPVFIFTRFSSGNFYVFEHRTNKLETLIFLLKCFTKQGMVLFLLEENLIWNIKLQSIQTHALLLLKYFHVEEFVIVLNKLF